MHVVIVGAGPAGLFLAYRLLALSPSYTVQIYECNQNPIDLEYFDKREFGVGLGTKLQHWLKSIDGLKEQLISEGIEFTPSGLILIPRRQLCALLLRSLLMRYGKQTSDESPRLSINFNVSVVDVDLARREVAIEKESSSQKVAYDLLVGADGIGSTIRNAMMAKPDENNFQQQQRPHVWKVLQLPMHPELQQSPPRIIRLQKRKTPFGLIFGGCLPRKDGGLTALIFWQPIGGSNDQSNPCGITTVEELQQLLQEMLPKNLPALKPDQDQATAFLAAKPGHEYWSQCRYYHDLEGRAVLIGDAAHGMFSLLGQGCAVAIGDAVVLESLLQQHCGDLSVALPEFSVQQVAEGHAASDLSLIALIVYHRWLAILYKVTTLLWVVVLRQPSIFERLGQVDTNYVQVLRENRLWIWFAKKLFSDLPQVSKRGRKYTESALDSAR